MLDLMIGVFLLKHFVDPGKVVMVILMIANVALIISLMLKKYWINCKNYKYSIYNIEIRINIVPDDNGIAKLSLVGIGRDSTVIPTAAAIIAWNGFTKRLEHRKADKNPIIVPLIVLFLL